MANWAWPHTPSSNWARLRLEGGPFAGEEVGFLPPDVAAPVQLVWTAWFPWGFTAYVYEWHGEVLTDRGRTDALVYRPSGRRVAADEIPPVIAEEIEMKHELVDRLALGLDVPAELLWPGI